MSPRPSRNGTALPPSTIFILVLQYATILALILSCKAFGLEPISVTTAT